SVHVEAALVEVEHELRSGAGRLRRRRAGDDRQTEVEAVAREDAGEARPDKEADAPGVHRLGDVLAGRARAEVRADDGGGAAAGLVAQAGVDALEQVALHRLDFGDVQVRARVEDVGVDVVSGDDHCLRLQPQAGTPSSTSAGSTISPATAAAAA